MVETTFDNKKDEFGKETRRMNLEQVFTNHSTLIMPPKKAAATLTKEKVYEFAKLNKNAQDILHYVTQHPKDLTDKPVNWSILHQIVFNANVQLLKDIIEIPAIYIPLDYKTNDGKTLEAVANESGHTAMLPYLKYLKDWDQMTELAKADLPNDSPVWQWITQNPSGCYHVAPSRKWSVAMQVCMYGNVTKFKKLITTCPLPVTENVWTRPSRDGSSLIAVAHNIGGAMLKYANTLVATAASDEEGDEEDNDDDDDEDDDDEDEEEEEEEVDDEEGDDDDGSYFEERDNLNSISEEELSKPNSEQLIIYGGGVDPGNHVDRKTDALMASIIDASPDSRRLYFITEPGPKTMAAIKRHGLFDDFEICDGDIEAFDSYTPTVLDAMPRLRKFTYPTSVLSGCDENFFECLAKLVEGMPFLEEVNLLEGEGVDFGVENICALIKNKPNLRVLKLDGEMEKNWEKSVMAAIKETVAAGTFTLEEFVGFDLKEFVEELNLNKIEFGNSENSDILSALRASQTGYVLK